LMMHSKVPVEKARGEPGLRFALIPRATSADASMWRLERKRESERARERERERERERKRGQSAIFNADQAWRWMTALWRELALPRLRFA